MASYNEVTLASESLGADFRMMAGIINSTLGVTSSERRLLSGTDSRLEMKDKGKGEAFLYNRVSIIRSSIYAGASSPFVSVSELVQYHRK